jgi:hypothetical protein
VLTIFTLASGRSGTHFLYQLFSRNAADCRAVHEPYVWNPSMFGRPIYDLAVGDIAAIRRLAERKARIIRRCGRPTYAETSHAFLKSWSNVAGELFPEAKFVHLVRDPLKVAKSEANRHAWLNAFHFPFRNYRGGDGRAYPRWALTTLEPIYRDVGETPVLTLFQRYVVQWIEIENRAMRFLDKFQKHAECITRESPHELNNAQRVREMFDFLGVRLSRHELDFGGRQNRNPQPTVIGDREQAEFAAIVARLPARYLEIFSREPYVRMPACESLRRVATQSVGTRPDSGTRLGPG